MTLPLRPVPESTLVVVAHPDDEVLGAGGSIAAMKEAGTTVSVCILSGSVVARRHRPSNEELLHDANAAAQLLGISRLILGDFPNLRMNAVHHIELVQFIESALLSTQSTRILTHHPSDLNDDHRQVSMACQAAARLSQRSTGLPRLRSLLYMEVLSSTEWSFRGGDLPFEPDTFIEIGEKNLNRKLEALAAYRDVMRPYPHPRSVEGVRGLASYRGAQAGLLYAESFQTAFHIVEA